MLSEKDNSVIDIYHITNETLTGIWNILGKNIWGIWNICLFDFS